MIELLRNLLDLLSANLMFSEQFRIVDPIGLFVRLSILFYSIEAILRLAKYTAQVIESNPSSFGPIIAEHNRVLGQITDCIRANRFFPKSTAERILNNPIFEYKNESPVSFAYTMGLATSSASFFILRSLYRRYADRMRYNVLARYRIPPVVQNNRILYTRSRFLRFFCIPLVYSFFYINK